MPNPLLSIKQCTYNLLAPQHIKQATRELRKLEGRLASPRMRLAVPFAFRSAGIFKSIRPRQNPLEIEALYERILELSPKRVLEIGTAKGGTLYLWTQAAADDATIVSVDLPGGEFGGGYPTSKEPFFKSFAKPGQTMHLYRCDSHKPESLQMVKDTFKGEKVDFAFIDGDHRYDGVRDDFLNYGALVREGGLIAFHDILPQPKSPETRVHQLWNEIRDHYQTWELIDDRDTNEKIGIGVLQVGDKGVFHPDDQAGA